MLAITGTTARAVVRSCAWLLAATPIAGPAAAAGTVYFANPGSIEFAPATGGPPQTLIPGLTNVRRVRIAGDKIYWVQTFPSRILRADLDGTSTETVVDTNFTAFGFDVDAAGAKIYYAVQSSILRANLDGSGVETLTAININPGDLELDVSGGKMYWTLVSTGLIQRANLDGTGVETLVSGIGNPNGLALDVAGGKLYWTDLFSSPDSIRRANLDGSSPEVLIDDADAVDADAIDLDPAGGRMYYQTTGGLVRRADLDGTGVETVAQASDTSVVFRGIAFLGGPEAVPSAGLRGRLALALLISLAGLAAVRTRRRRQRA